MTQITVVVPEKSANEKLIDVKAEAFAKSIEHLPIPSAKAKQLIAGFKLGYRQSIIDSE